MKTIEEVEMPTYDYRCDACEHQFEEFQSFSESPLKKCPKCGKNKLQRLIGTGAAVIFKGSGFYQTDYRSESYKSAAKADEAKSTPASDSSTPDKSTTKSEGKGETPSSKSSDKPKTPKSKD